MIVVVGFSDFANAGSFRPHERSMGDFFYALEPFCQFFFIKQKMRPGVSGSWSKSSSLNALIFCQASQSHAPNNSQDIQETALGKGAFATKIKNKSIVLSSSY